MTPEQRGRMLALAGVSATRDFNPSLHPHDPHTGKWMDVPDAVHRTSWDDVMDLYGEQIDEAPFGDGNLISVHADGDVLWLFDHKPDGDGSTPDRIEAVAAFDADSAERLASRIESLADEAEAYDPNDPDATEVSPNGLVDWTTVDGTLVGYDRTGDILIRVTDEDLKTTAQLDAANGADLTVDEARDMADALRDMADRADELDED